MDIFRNPVSITFESITIVVAFTIEFRFTIEVETFDTFCFGKLEGIVECPIGSRFPPLSPVGVKWWAAVLRSLALRGSTRTLQVA